MRSEKPKTKVGDVVIRHNDAAPLLYIVGSVLKDGDLRGDLNGSNPVVVEGRNRAIEHARSLRGSPTGRIYMIQVDGEWEEVT
jgi:hypothetical protein